MTQVNWRDDHFASMEDPRLCALSAAVHYLDLYAPQFLESEYEIYKLLRSFMPVAPVLYRERAGLFPGVEKTFFITRYEDVAYILHRPDIFSNENEYKWIPQGVDPPEHTEYRRILNPLFTQQALSPLEGQIRSLCCELLDKMVSKEEFDFISEFAEPFPTTVFCKILGTPLEDLPLMMRWKDIMIHAGTPGKAESLGIQLYDEQGRFRSDEVERARQQAVKELYDYFRAYIKYKRTHPGEDLITHLVNARYGGERPLTEDELLRTMLLMVMAGLDTVTAALGLSLFYLATHPDKRQEFVALIHQEHALRSAVEELLRFVAFVSPGRRITRHFKYRGLEFEPGWAVTLSIPSANRDEAVFDRPEEVDFLRTPNPHMAFGLGPHRCLGMHLARRELRIALQEFHRRVPDYAIAPGRQVRLYGGGVKGVLTLPIQVLRRDSG